MNKVSLILLDQTAIDKCSTTQEEFDSWVEILIKHLGSGALAAAQKNFSLSHVSHIGRCALILKALSEIDGFNKIMRQIYSQGSFSLYEPHGEWFHLHVAYLLHALGEEGLKLEQVINGKPKDIWLRGGSLLIECKSFDISSTFRKILFSQDPTLGPEDDERTFTLRLRRLGYSGLSSPIGISEEYRFVRNAIEEKYHQMETGRCNVLAFNLDPFGRSANGLRPPLLKILQEEGRKLISAFLVLGRRSDSNKTLKSRSFGFDVDLVCNPTAAVVVPEDLVEQLEGRGSIELP